MMPAGKYWIGDLCYVMHNHWEEFCSFEEGEGEIEIAGKKIAWYGTLYGDGVYFDEEANEYPVDAGLIGCIKVDDIDDPEKNLSLGNIVEFLIPFSTEIDKGIIKFGNIQIDTLGCEDEEDYEDDYDKDDEEDYEEDEV